MILQDQIEALEQHIIAHEHITDTEADQRREIESLHIALAKAQAALQKEQDLRRRYDARESLWRERAAKSDEYRERLEALEKHIPYLLVVIDTISQQFPVFAPKLDAIMNSLGKIRLSKQPIERLYEKAKTKVDKL